MDAGWNGSAKRYTGGKILVANLPDVEIGSVIEVEFEITSKAGKPFLAGFEPFQLPDALEHKSFAVTAPKRLQVQRLVSGPADILRAGHVRRQRPKRLSLGGRRRQGAARRKPVAAGMDLQRRHRFFHRRRQ